MENKYIEKDNVKIYTESFGDSTNPAVILIMGLGSSLIWWDESFCELLVEQGYYVIRYDNRDTGKSTVYPHNTVNYTIDDLTDDVIKILDVYKIEKAHFIGMSMGSVVAQLIGYNYPNRVLSLSLIASYYLGNTHHDLPVYTDEVKEFFASYDATIPKDVDEYVEKILVQWQVTNKSSRYKDLAHIRKMIKLDITRANDYESRMNHSLLVYNPIDLDKISSRVLLVHGDEDIVLPLVHAQKLHEELPNSRLVILSGAGHELNPDDYQIFITAFKSAQN